MIYEKAKVNGWPCVLAKFGDGDIEVATGISKSKVFLYTLLAVILSRFVKPKYINLYKQGRGVGNTTRLTDMFVQDFFNKGKCQIYDHYNTRESRQRVFDLVLQRLNREHHIEKQDVYLDRSRLIIRKNNR